MSTIATAEPPRSTLWENYPDTMTRADYEYSHADYLSHVLPRQIAGWNLLSQEDRDSLTAAACVRWEAWKLEYPDWVNLN